MPASSASSAASPRDCFLVLAGESPIPVSDVEGGALVGDLVTDPAGAFTHKHVTAIHVEDIAFSVSLPLPATLQSWLATVLGGQVERRSGAFVLVDAQLRVRERRTFLNALPVSVELPTLDAASKAPLRLRVRLTVASIASVAGDDSKLSVPLGAKTKGAFARDFRLELGDLPTRRLASLQTGPLTVSPAFQGGLQIGYPDLQLSLAATDIGPWRDFATSFLVKAVNGPADERQGRLVVLSANQKDELLALELQGVGLHSFEPAWPGASPAGRFTARLYVERITFAAKAKIAALAAGARRSPVATSVPARGAAAAARPHPGRRAAKPRARSASQG